MKKKSVLSLVSFLLCAVLFSSFSPVFAEDAVLSDNISWKAEGSTLYFEGSGDMTLTYKYITEIPWYNLRTEIDTVSIGEGITSIGESAFCDFVHLKTVTLPESLKTIGECAFLTCTSLETLVLPDRVTKIEGGAFVGCESLSSLSIPGNVYYISSDAFFNCYNLTIKGIPGSYCEDFAKEHAIPFDGSRALPSDIFVTVNHEILTFDQPPTIINDRTLVPLRAIFEALGALVNWDPDTRTVTATRGDIHLSLVVDTNIINKNGTNIEIDVPAQIVNDRTMVPARAVAETLGASVNWNKYTRTVVISD